MRRRITCQALFQILLFGWLTIPAQSGTWPEEEACALAVPAPLNSAVRMSGFASTKSELFALDVASPGVLGLEAAVSGTERTEPILLFLGLACTTIDHVAPPQGEAKAFTYIDHSNRSHLVEVREPGVYFVRIVAADPLWALGNYKLSNRFVERTPQLVETPNKSDDDEIDIDEWDEEILSGNLIFPGTPIAGDDSHETRSNEFCSHGQGGDPDAFSWCATPVTLGEFVQGELASPWSDDFEYFTFTLDRTQVLRIETFSSVNTFGTLYDLLGNRLAASGGGGDGGNFAITRVLPPGRYTLRVESLIGSEGSYDLVVRPEVGLIE